MNYSYPEQARRYQRQFVHGVITEGEYEDALVRLDLAFLSPLTEAEDVAYDEDGVPTEVG